MAVVSTTNAVSLTKKKARPQTITKKGPGAFVERGKVRLGKNGDWSEVGDIGMQIFKSEPPQIGLWGIVKNGSKPFKEIAEQVYGDAGKAKFILEANKIHRDVAFKGQQLYIPNLNYNRLKQYNQFVNSNYYYTHADIFSIKPIIQVAGDVYIHYDCAYVSQHYYVGKDYDSKLVASEELTFKEFYEGITQSAYRASKWISKHSVDTYYAAGKAIYGSVKNKDLRYFKTKVEKGVRSFKINKTLKGIDIEPSMGRWIGYGEFAGRLFRGAFSKGNIIMMAIVAGIKTALDWMKHWNIKHATCTFGKEMTKALISTAVGAGLAAIFAIFIPGPGWVLAASIVFTALASLYLDWYDEHQENIGHQKWAY
jgi:hypothetical protein